MSRQAFRWSVLFIVLFFSVAAPLNQFKIAPIMPLLMDAFRLSAVRGGLLMSIFAVTALILAIPAGFIFRRLGYKVTGLIAVLSIITGSLIGLVHHGFWTLLLGRFIEGIGKCFIGVVAPAIIAIWFTSEMRGRAMGIWAIWVPVGSLITYAVSPAIAGLWGWQGVWWFGLLYTLLIGIVYQCALPANPPGYHDRAEGGNPETDSRGDVKEVFKNRNVLLTSLLICCYNFTMISFMTWMPTFLHKARGFSLGHASGLMVVLTVFLIVSSPLGGWVSDRLGSRKFICLVPMLFIMLALPASSFLSNTMLLPLLAAIGLLAGFVATGIYTIGADAIRNKKLSGLVMAIIAIGQNTGILLGPLSFGWLLDRSGNWQVAFLGLAPVAALGALSSWMMKIK